MALSPTFIRLEQQTELRTDRRSLTLRLHRPFCHGTVAGSPHLRLPRLAVQVVSESFPHRPQPCNYSDAMCGHACARVCFAARACLCASVFVKHRGWIRSCPAITPQASLPLCLAQGKDIVTWKVGLKVGPGRRGWRPRPRTSAPQATCPSPSPTRAKPSKVSGQHGGSTLGNDLAWHCALRDWSTISPPLAAKTRKSKGAPLLPFRELH